MKDYIKMDDEPTWQKDEGFFKQLGEKWKKENLNKTLDGDGSLKPVTRLRKR